MGEHRRPAKGGVHLSREQLALASVLSLAVATGSLSTDVIGVFGSAPTVIVTNPAVSRPKPSKNRAEMLAFLRAAEARAAAQAQVAQAEIEALAGMEVPGRRADIVDQIKELSAQKSRYESEARYYRQAANQLASDE